MPQRCDWVTDDPAYLAYHDEEWGVPVYDDRVFFEFLILEGAQAGLNWLTILKRREGYRKAFADFDPAKVAKFTEADHAKLREDTGIIRNKLKIASATKNATAFLEIQHEFGSFSNYVWQFVGGSPITRSHATMADVPATTEQSDALSKDLKKRGMSFVGSTIMYAFMQATGLVNDHTTDCFRYKKVMVEQEK